MRTWLQNLRNEKNMTHADVATNSNIKRPYYTMIENGTRSPSVKVAKRIANVLGFNWTIFFENQGNVMTQKSVNKAV